MHFLLTLAFVCLHLYSHGQVTVCSYDFNTGLNGWTAIDISDATDVFTAIQDISK